MSCVLIVEDEKRLRDIVRDYFTGHGLDCDLARDGAEALDLLRDHDYDAILLDILMPGLDGFAVCEAVRRSDDVPILFLTALGSERDVLRGYALGCDDYVTKPFSMRILLKKVYVILSRKSQEANIYDDGFLKVDFELGIVQQGVNECLLSPTEYRILKKLIENKGKLLTYSVLLDSLWDEGVQITDKHTLAVNINRLRKKIETEEHSYISNVYGMGYIWK